MNFLDLLKIEFMKVKRSKNYTLDFHCTFIGSDFRGCKFEQLFYAGIH